MTPDELVFARAFVARVQWTFTTALAPHSYLVRSQVPVELQGDFDRFTRLIEQHGTPGRFQGVTYTYLEVGEHRYWSSRTLFHETGWNLNRARLDQIQPDPQLELDLGAAS